MDPNQSNQETLMKRLFAIAVVLLSACSTVQPSDPFAQFLLAAKEDVLRATHNSREFAAAMSRTSRGFSGSGYYWLPL